MLLRNSHRYSSFLRELPLFAACTDAQLDRIAGAGTRSGVERGQVVVAEGSFGHDFYVLLSGRALVSRAGSYVTTLDAGTWFGELAALDGQRRDATVTMLSNGEVFVVGRREFASLIDLVPEVTRRLLVGMAQRLHVADAHTPPYGADLPPGVAVPAIPEPR